MNLFREAEVVEAPPADPAQSAGGARSLTVQLFRWDDPRPVIDTMPELRQYRERWARDSIPYVEDDGRGPRVYDAHHGSVIGHVARLWDAGPGPHARLVVADTTNARDALALVEAGTTGGVSVEFQPVDGGEVWNAERSEVTRTRAALTGVAFAFQPAHDSPILATREDPTMTDTLDAVSPASETPAPAPSPSVAGPVSVDAVRGELDELRRAVVEVGRGGAMVTSTPPRYRSLGDMMQGAARGDLAGSEWIDPEGRGAYLTRAIVDVTTTDVPGLIPRPAVAAFYQAISAAQPLVEAAGTFPLPDSGMDVTFPSVTTRPSVAQQVTEKTDVASVKTQVARVSVPVITLAGGEDTSIQVILRSDPSYLTLMGQLYAEAMAIATDSYAYARYDAATLPAGHLASIGTAATGWVAAIANLAGLILKDSKRLPNRMVVSVDLWQKLVGAADADGRPLFPNTSPSNPVGDSSLASTEGNLRGLTWSVDPNFPTDRGVLFNSQAFVMGLGPVQTMTADSPTKLGRDYAMFRFGAACAIDAAGMAMFATGTAPTTTGGTEDETTTTRSRK